MPLTFVFMKSALSAEEVLSFEHCLSSLFNLKKLQQLILLRQSQWQLCSCNCLHTFSQYLFRKAFWSSIVTKRTSNFEHLREHSLKYHLLSTLCTSLYYMQSYILLVIQLRRHGWAHDLTKKTVSLHTTTYPEKYLLPWFVHFLIFAKWRFELIFLLHARRDKISIHEMFHFSAGHLEILYLTCNFTWDRK